MESERLSVGRSNRDREGSQEVTPCAVCAIQKSCLWSGLSDSSRARLAGIMRPAQVVGEAQSIVRAGQRLHALYVLRSGTVKAWNVTRDGHEHIIRFNMSGDVLGLGAINGGVYDCNVTTLDTCSVCEIPFGQFQNLAEEIPALNYTLLRMMSRELVEEESQMIMRSHRSAPARLAGFLQGLSRRFGERGFSRQEFHLTMGRREIANYLGLALETVSRTLSQFQDNGLLTVNGKRIQVNDEEQLALLGQINETSTGRASAVRSQRLH